MPAKRASTLIIARTMPPFLSILALAASGSIRVDAMKLLLRRTLTASPSPQQKIMTMSPTALYADNNRWWDRDGNAMSQSSGESETKKYDKSYRTANNEEQNQPSLITREMEEEVMASARAAMDSNVVSGAISSLIDNSGDIEPRQPGRWGNQASENTQNETRSKNKLRDLASSAVQSSASNERQFNNSDNENSWDAQQIAMASGATTFLISPLVIPIIHSFVPPILPFPSSISFTGAALLGTMSYIVALGDPTDKSNIISEKAGGVLGDGAVEVGGAVSRIMGRTALQSVQTSAPRLKAAARALVDFDSNNASVEELQRVQRELSQTVLELGTENDALRKEVALWQAVEDVSSMYKLEELKEMARYKGLKGYSTEGKNALLRRLVREGIINLDFSGYY